MQKKKIRSSKKKWKDMEIIAVKLNPEQAVLSCCWSQTRVGAWGGTMCSTQHCPTLMFDFTSASLS